MKKRILCSIAALVLSSHFLTAECSRCPKVVPFSEFTEEAFEEFSEGNLSSIILECAEGTILPFTVRVKGDFLEFTNEGGSFIKVTKTIYAKCEEEAEFLFSSDLVEWKPFSEFFTGQIQSTVSIEDGQPVAGLELELNQR